jgi:hypothetical protein
MKPLEDPDRIRELVTEYFVFARRLASPSRSERLVAQTGNPLDDLLTRWLPSGATSQPLGSCHDRSRTAPGSSSR